jgi:hypothetical protein
MITAPEVSKFQVDAADNDSEPFEMPYNVRGKPFNEIKLDDFCYEYNQITSFIENEMPSLLIEDSSDSSDYSGKEFSLNNQIKKFKSKENIKKNLLDYEFKLKQELKTLEYDIGMKLPNKSHLFKFDDIKPFNFKQPMSCVSKVKLVSSEYKNPYEGIKKFVEEDENLAKKLKRGSHFNLTIPKWIEFKDYVSENIEENDEESECCREEFNTITGTSTSCSSNFKSSLY